MSRQQRRIMTVTAAVMMVAVSAGAGWCTATAAGSRTVGSYTAGEQLVVTVDISYTGSLSALGLEDTIPTGWTYVSCSGTNPPQIMPTVGAGGSLGFGWITIPASPLQFTYTLQVPASASGQQTISGEVIFRETLGTEQRSQLDDSVISPEAPTAPQTVSINPNSGSYNVTTNYQFVTTHTDANGWDTLAHVRLLINSALSGRSCLYAVYDVANDKLYLSTDDGQPTLGGYAPGSAHVISNSNGSINCAGCQADGTGNNLSMTWSVGFKNGLSGNNELYVKTQDQTGLADNWRDFGDITIVADQAPENGTVTPDSGTLAQNTWHTFTTTYTDANGYADLTKVRLLINGSLSGAKGFYCIYDITSDQLWMAGNDGAPDEGGYAAGSANTIENAYTALDCSGCSLSGDGTTATMTWRIMFQPPFTSTRYLYLRCQDAAGHYSSWQQKGSVYVTPSNTPPVNSGVSPSAGSYANDRLLYFTTTHSDADGADNIYRARMLINDRLVGSSCLYVLYDANLNLMYLRSNGATSWMGGHAPGSSITLQNSYARLHLSRCVVTPSGNDLQVTWAVSFTPEFTGARTIYQKSEDYSRTIDNWEAVGSATIGATTMRWGLPTPTPVPQLLPGI